MTYVGYTYIRYTDGVWHVAKTSGLSAKCGASFDPKWSYKAKMWADKIERTGDVPWPMEKRCGSHGCMEAFEKAGHAHRAH